MTDLILDYPLEEARTIIAASLHRTEGISTVETSEFQVVGKTGISFPRVLWSYGETVYVDLSESREENTTPISVSGEKRIPINIGANPDTFIRRFLGELEEAR